jgi:DeoR/GlpR family transcriptional regulator of sugar metabolism
VSTSTRQRREKILGQVYETGHVAVKDLAGTNLVELVYGGASLVRSYDFSFRSKMTRNLEGKKVIGKLAADLVPDGDTILLDSGTTCFQMVPLLKRKRGMKVIANSARLALELDAPGLDVILIGGQYRPERMDTIGPLATAMLEQLRGYVAFIGTDGLGMDFGLTASDIESAHFYRVATRNARQVVLLVDHTKFASPSLFKIVDFDVVSHVVTDKLPSREWLDFFESKEIKLVVPPQGSLPASSDADKAKALSGTRKAAE